MNGIFPAWIGPCSVQTTTEKVFIEVPSGAGGGGIFMDPKYNEKNYYRNIKVTATINMSKVKKKPKIIVKAKIK